MSHQLSDDPVHVVSRADGTKIPDVLAGPSCNAIEAGRVIEELANQVRLTAWACHGHHVDGPEDWTQCPHGVCHDSSQLLRRLGL